jgi:hypothetical protein
MLAAREDKRTGGFASSITASRRASVPPAIRKRSVLSSEIRNDPATVAILWSMETYDMLLEYV